MNIGLKWLPNCTWRAEVWSFNGNKWTHLTEDVSAVYLQMFGEQVVDI